METRVFSIWCVTFHFPVKNATFPLREPCYFFVPSLTFGLGGPYSTIFYAVGNDRRYETSLIANKVPEELVFEVEELSGDAAGWCKTRLISIVLFSLYCTIFVVHEARLVSHRYL